MLSEAVYLLKEVVMKKPVFNFSSEDRGKVIFAQIEIKYRTKPSSDLNKCYTSTNFTTHHNMVRQSLAQVARQALYGIRNDAGQAGPSVSTFLRRASTIGASGESSTMPSVLHSTDILQTPHQPHTPSPLTPSFHHPFTPKSRCPKSFCDPNTARR